MVDATNSTNQLVSDNVGLVGSWSYSRSTVRQSSGVGEEADLPWGVITSQLARHGYAPTSYQQVQVHQAPRWRGVGNFRIIPSSDESVSPPSHQEATVLIRNPEQFRMDLLPLVADLARRAAEVVGHDVRAEAREIVFDGDREVFVEIPTTAVSSSDELLEVEDFLTNWLIDTDLEAGREVTVYVRRA